MQHALARQSVASLMRPGLTVVNCVTIQLCRFNACVMQRPKGFFSARVVFCEYMIFHVTFSARTISFAEESLRELDKLA